MQSHHFAAVMNHYIHFDEASMSEGSVSHDHELGEDDPRPEAGSKEENKEENALQRPPAPLWMRVLAATALADMQVNPRPYPLPPKPQTRNPYTLYLPSRLDTLPCRPPPCCPTLRRVGGYAVHLRSDTLRFSLVYEHTGLV